MPGRVQERDQRRGTWDDRPASIRAMLGGAVADRGDNPSVDEIVTLLAVWVVPLVVLFGVVYLAVRLATRSSRRP